MLLVAASLTSFAQKYSVGTNVLDYLNLATINAEGSFAVSRHWSLTAGAKYNPFTFEKKGEPMTGRQQVYSLGARWWPWNVYSGWWLGAKGQYQEYNRGAGFSYMVHPHVNIDLGAGVWGGYDVYTRYTCPVCGFTKESGERWFILPNDIILSLIYVF